MHTTACGPCDSVDRAQDRRRPADRRPLRCAAVREQSPPDGASQQQRVGHPGHLTDDHTVPTTLPTNMLLTLCARCCRPDQTRLRRRHPLKTERLSGRAKGHCAHTIRRPQAPADQRASIERINGHRQRRLQNSAWLTRRRLDHQRNQALALQTCDLPTRRISPARLPLHCCDSKLPGAPSEVACLQDSCSWAGRGRDAIDDGHHRRRFDRQHRSTR